MKKPIKHEALKTWVALNDAIRVANEELCHRLIKVELAGRRRAAFLKRIHSRLNKVRADREREELV